VGALGKVFSVETVKKETTRGATMDVTQLAIVTDAGELRLFELRPGVNCTLRGQRNPRGR
jgi:hypothetical protein